MKKTVVLTISERDIKEFILKKFKAEEMTPRRTVQCLFTLDFDYNF